MDKIPFNVYDFFAYLSSGSMLVLTADTVWKLGLLTRHDISPVLGISLLIISYVTGHVVAHFSSFFLEQLFVGKLLKRPATLLLGAAPRTKILKWVFPNYHHALPGNVQNRVRQQATARGCTASDDGLFLHIYPIVTSNERLQARQDIFLNQYGFARNMSFAFFTSAIWLLSAYWWGLHFIHLRWAYLALLGGVGMLYRYLKFFRQYSYELLIRYAELAYQESKTASVGA